VLQISQAVLSGTLAAFIPFAKRKVEACCFWYGRGDESGNGQVFAIVIPWQENHWGNYTVPANAMAAVSQATRSFGWRNLAQVHTHPGRGVEHSPYDDEHVNSRRALSLVLPQYGKWRGLWPQGIGVHEFQEDYWHLLADEAARQRITVLTIDGDIQILELRNAR
jgi:hypothetical protein